MTIKTKRVDKGDFVPGHSVACFMPLGLPALLGSVRATSKTGHRVTVRFNDAALWLGITGDQEFSWRRSAGSYQHIKSKTTNGVGLALIPKGKAA